MEKVTVTITTDTPISVKVVRCDDNNGLTKLLQEVKNAGAEKNESQRKTLARNYGT